MKISIIAAIAEKNVIGKDNKIPWYIPADMKHFKEITWGHTVIMGQKTYESIGKALPGRKNIVLSFDTDYKCSGCVATNSINEALRIAADYKETEVFIIGGASVYKQTINIAEKLYITKVHHKFEGDSFFPKIDLKIWRIDSLEKNGRDNTNPFDYDFMVYKKAKC
jgi:dihydrofolate reductase